MTQGIIDLNLADIKDPFSPIDRGRYTIQCTEAEDTTSKAQERMLKLTFQVVGHAEFAGRNIFEYLMLEGKGAPGGLWRLRQYAEAAGIDINSSWELTSLQGQNFDVEVAVEPGSGQYGPSNRVTNVYGS